MTSSQYQFHELQIIHVFLWPLKVLWRAIYLYSLLCLFCVIAFLVGAAYLWSDGVATAEHIYRQTIDFSVGHASDLSMATLAGKSSELSYWLFFGLTHLHDITTNLENQILGAGVEQTIAQAILRPWLGELKVAALGVKMFGARIGTLVAGWPIVLLGYLCGIADGLVDRYIRSACAGRESSSLYHRAKYAQLGLSALGAMVFLCWPYYLDVRWLLFPLSFGLALLARIQWKYYKKYL